MSGAAGKFVLAALALAAPLGGCGFTPLPRFVLTGVVVPAGTASSCAIACWASSSEIPSRSLTICAREARRHCNRKRSVAFCASGSIKACCESRRPGSLSRSQA